MIKLVAQWLITAALVSIGIRSLVGFARDITAERRAFMTECKQDHKEYECTAMWRK